MNTKWMGVIVGMVALTIAIVMFPTVLSGTASITGHTHVDTFTGLSNIAKIGPLVIFVSLIFTTGMGFFITGRKLLGK